MEGCKIQCELKGTVYCKYDCFNNDDFLKGDTNEKQNPKTNK